MGFGFRFWSGAPDHQSKKFEWKHNLENANGVWISYSFGFRESKRVSYASGVFGLVRPERTMFNTIQNIFLSARAFLSLAVERFFL
jgi:hypothetical protein